MLWAFHVVIVGRFSRDAEPVRFSLIQLGMTGVAALAVALVPPAIKQSTDTETNMSGPGPRANITPEENCCSAWRT